MIVSAKPVMKYHLLNIVFPSFEKELIKDLGKKGVLRSFKKDEVIVKMGQTLSQSLIILQGSVKIFREGENGSEYLVGFLQAGQSFAMAFYDDSPENQRQSLVTIYAVKTSYVLSIPLFEKDLLAKKYDSWYKYVLDTTQMYYRFYLKMIDNIAFKNLELRIEFFLEGLSIVTNNRVLETSHREIAKSLNCSREAVSRQLKSMQDSGRIVLGHNRIELVNF
jgi:CRP/FNR family transcriptional regulator, anaerobic regulatory protein